MMRSSAPRMQKASATKDLSIINQHSTLEDACQYVRVRKTVSTFSILKMDIVIFMIIRAASRIISYHSSIEETKTEIYVASRGKKIALKNGNGNSFPILKSKDPCIPKQIKVSYIQRSFYSVYNKIKILCILFPKSSW